MRHCVSSLSGVRMLSNCKRRINRNWKIKYLPWKAKYPLWRWIWICILRLQFVWMKSIIYRLQILPLWNRRSWQESPSFLLFLLLCLDLLLVSLLHILYGSNQSSPIVCSISNPNVEFLMVNSILRNLFLGIAVVLTFLVLLLFYSFVAYKFASITLNKIHYYYPFLFTKQTQQFSSFQSIAFKKSPQRYSDPVQHTVTLSSESPTSSTNWLASFTNRIVL